MKKHHKSIAPTVEIDLDRTRHLLFDFAALEAIEDALDSPGITLGAEFWGEDLGKMTIKRARIALWAALLNHDPELTMEKLSELIKGKRPAFIIGKVLTAWALSKIVQDEDVSANPPIPETNQSHGSGSGVSPATILA